MILWSHLIICDLFLHKHLVIKSDHSAQHVVSGSSGDVFPPPCKILRWRSTHLSCKHFFLHAFLKCFSQMFFSSFFSNFISIASCRWRSCHLSCKHVFLAVHSPQYDWLLTERGKWVGKQDIIETALKMSNVCFISKLFSISYVRRSDSGQGKKDYRVNLILALPLKTHYVYFHQKPEIPNRIGTP